MFTVNLPLLLSALTVRVISWWRWLVMDDGSMDVVIEMEIGVSKRKKVIPVV